MKEAELSKASNMTGSACSLGVSGALGGAKLHIIKMTDIMHNNETNRMVCRHFHLTVHHILTSALFLAAVIKNRQNCVLVR